jgi:glycosyltransferase involved in cell wall biosynthesis
MKTGTLPVEASVTPDVSVVLGVHNGQARLRTSLQSVLGQEGVNLELIVVDDGSTDATPAILGELAAEDRRVRVIRQENHGLTHALIVGCSIARGEFIARHDADDVSLPGRLPKQLGVLWCNPHVSFVSCWARALGPRDEVLFETQRPADPREATELFRRRRQGPSHHGSVVFRRLDYERVGGYRREFYFAQDNDLWLRLSDVGQISYVPETLYEFRVSNAAISSSYRSVQHALGELGHLCQKARRAGESEEALLRQAAELRPGRKGSAVPDLVAGDYFIGRCLLSRGDRRARRYLLNVLKRRPWNCGAWLGVYQTCFLEKNPC